MAGSSVSHAHDTHHEHEQDGELWEGGKEPFKASYGKLMMWYFLVSDAFTFAGFLIAYGALRFSMPTWPEADFVFGSFPFVNAHWPLVFVTLMTFILIFSSVTMVRAVQEGHRENQKGVVFWMFLTVLGGAAFLGCQAYEWTMLIKYENVSVGRNPFGRYIADGVVVDKDGKELLKDGTPEIVKKDQSYLLHGHEIVNPEGKKVTELTRPYVKYTSGQYAGQTQQLKEGPFQFGALFFFITGFHGFHVFSGVVFLAIIAMNSAGGMYAARKNGYEMVEKIGLYWHFVDLVWVFVFLLFYLL
jgi:cytochrome c oxidase subunit III